MVSYQTFQPCPPLRYVVEHYWRSHGKLNAAIIQEFATPLLQGLTFNLKKLPESISDDHRVIRMNQSVYLFGQPTQSRISESNSAEIDIIGIKFSPVGIYRLTGIHMEHIANEIIDATDIWGNEIPLLCEKMAAAGNITAQLQILEAFLIEKLSHQHKLKRNPIIDHALQLLNHHQGNISIRALQEATFTTRKSLERAFLTQLGITPKLYARIIRFNHVKQLIESSPLMDWQEIAFQAGYYDHPHLVNEFRYFSGKTPGEYQQLVISLLAASKETQR